MKKYFLYIAAAAFLMTACDKEPLLEDPPEEVPVTGVTLNLPDALLLVGGTLTLEATIEPGNATNETVTWSSDDDSVTTVSPEGEVTAVASGTAKITVTTDDGGFSASCSVTVEEDPPISDTGVITMTTLASGVSLWIKIDTSLGSDNFTIDWGDGEESNLYPTMANPYSDTESFTFSHSYSDASEHLITITGDNIVLLQCSENQLTSLDISRYPELQILFCLYNQLTTLDVSKNTALEDLWCDYNQLTSLDVSKNTVLAYLQCNYNQLTSLDVSKNTALNGLCVRNCQLTTLDVSNNTALTQLLCSSNQITTLDVSANTELQWLSCHSNQLTSSALNNLFNTLPDRTGKTSGNIVIASNPGTNDCDVSIVKEKGWSFPKRYPTRMENTEELFLPFYEMFIN